MCLIQRAKLLKKIILNTKQSREEYMGVIQERQYGIYHLI